MTPTGEESMGEVETRRFRLIAENVVWLVVSAILIGLWFWWSDAWAIVASMGIAGIVARLSVE
jgi:small-conductance mechanosensitive channel